MAGVGDAVVVDVDMDGDGVEGDGGNDDERVVVERVVEGVMGGDDGKGRGKARYVCACEVEK
jgi:hypothetical protein